jgi:cyclic pyranopterin phosphate synthase
VAAELGIRKLRLTGGEPLVRKELPRLVERLAVVPGIDELAMTSNGILLTRYADILKAAGLDRLNISLDTLDPEKSRQIARRRILPQVLEGITAARQAGFQEIKLNAVAIRGLNEEDIVPLARFARDSRLQLRFIEFMPIDGHPLWNSDRVLPAEEILDILSKTFGPLEPVVDQPSGPASEYRFLEGGGRIGLIRSVSHPFCDQCDRLRLTADGTLRNCLFSAQQWNVRTLLRTGGTAEQLVRLIRNAVEAKKAAHGTDNGQFGPAERPMHQIGG